MQWCWVWHMRMEHAVWCLPYAGQGGNEEEGCNEEEVPPDLHRCAMGRRSRAMNCNTIWLPLAHSQAVPSSAKGLPWYACYRCRGMPPTWHLRMVLLQRLAT